MSIFPKTRRSFLRGLGGLALSSAATPLLHARDSKKASSAKHELEISGDIYQRGDTAYEQSRQNAVWGAIKPKRYPELIVLARTEEDIVATIRYARSKGLQVAVRGGGHNYIARPIRLANETAWIQQPQTGLQTVAKHFVKAPPGKTVIIANYRSNTEWPEDTACSVTGPLFLNWSTRWKSIAEDALHLQWMDELAASMEEVMSGCYVNETDFIRRPHWAKLCYSSENWKRLADIQKQYDPDGILPPAFTI